MSDTLALRQSLFQQIDLLMDDDEALRKACDYLKSLVTQSQPQDNAWADEEEELTAQEKAEILDDIRDGLREVKAAREGGYELQSVRNFLHEMGDL